MGDEIRTDEWLSRQLGIPCFSWKGGDSAFPLARWRALTSGLSDWMLTAQLPEASLPRGGVPDLPGRALLCDTRVTFRWERSPHAAIPGRDDSATGHANFLIRAMEAGDARAVADIARRAFVHSRFHKDPRIPASQAADLKGEWAANLARGTRGEGGWLVEVSGVPAGFIALVRGSDPGQRQPRLAVDLVAIDPAFGGRGLGGQLLTTAMAYADDQSCDLVASTQESNAPAIRMYLGSGLLRTGSAEYIFHSRPETVAVPPVTGA